MAPWYTLVDTVIHLANLHFKNICKFQKPQIKKMFYHNNILGVLRQHFSWTA